MMKGEMEERNQFIVLLKKDILGYVGDGSITLYIFKYPV